MRTIAVIQARMGSTRLPGKVMLSLDCTPVIQHIIRRTISASSIDAAVVATTEKDRDNIIASYASEEGAQIFRGDEKDVLGRMYQAAGRHSADAVVRVTADNPLLAPDAIDSAVRKLKNGDAEYVSNKVDRSFPSGLDVEVFTYDSFNKIEKKAEGSHYREHVTPYYFDSGEFKIANLTSDEVFDEPFMQNRTDLRLTLDNPCDYELFKMVYENVPYENVLNAQDAVGYIDRNNIGNMNID